MFKIESNTAIKFISSIIETCTSLDQLLTCENWITRIQLRDEDRKTLINKISVKSRFVVKGVL